MSLFLDEENVLLLLVSLVNCSFFCFLRNIIICYGILFLLLQVNECICVSQTIGDLLFLDDESGQEINSYEFVPAEFFEGKEFPWKGRVKRIHAEESYDQVDRAAEALSVAVSQLSL